MTETLTKNSLGWSTKKPLPEITITDQGFPCFSGENGNSSEDSCKKGQSGLQCQTYKNKIRSCDRIDTEIPQNISGEMNNHLAKLNRDKDDYMKKAHERFARTDRELTLMIADHKNKQDFRKVEVKLRNNNLRLVNHKRSESKDLKKGIEKTINQNEIDLLDFHQEKTSVDNGNNQLPTMFLIIKIIMAVWIFSLFAYYILADLQ